MQRLALGDDLLPEGERCLDDPVPDWVDVGLEIRPGEFRAEGRFPVTNPPIREISDEFAEVVVTFAAHEDRYIVLSSESGYPCKRPKEEFPSLRWCVIILAIHRIDSR